MSNLLGNPSFETVSYWSFETSGEREWWDWAAHDGEYVARLALKSGQVAAGIVSQTGLELVRFRYYPVSLWLWSSSVDYGGIEVEVDPGTGSYESLGTRDTPTDQVNWELWEVGEFMAEGSTGRIRISGDQHLVVNRGWWIDLVAVDDPGAVVTTNDLRTDLAADLATVSGLNVAEHPGDRLKLALPAALIRSPGDGDADVASLTARSAEATQRFGVELHLAGDQADVEDLLDEIRNAVDQSTSNLNTRAGVRFAMVTDWADVEGSEFMRGENHKFTLTVEVGYQFVRGSL